MPLIAPLDLSSPVIDGEGRVLPDSQNWFDRITNLDLIVGTGDPEGVVSAEQGRLYMNDTGAPVLYIKQQASIGGNGKLGWVSV